MPQTPFVLFPWSKPFLPDMIRFLAQQTDPAQAVLLLPNARPVRYIIDLFRCNHYVGLLPTLLPIEDTTHAWLAANEPLLPFASVLDAIDLLYHVVRDALPDDPFLKHAFHAMSLQHFWPWGIRLYQLLEELYTHGISPKDIEIQPSAPQNANALFAALGRIHEGYQEALSRHGLTTQGSLLARIAKNTTTLPPMLDPQKHPVFCCGFSHMVGAVEHIVHSLWQNGAHMLIHADPNLVLDPLHAHHACHCFADLAKRWNTHIVLAHEECTPTKPRIRFFAGFDAHSELLALKASLTNQDPTLSCALVLANPDLLIPALHHLPRTDVNISLGYPLARTLLGQLFANMGRLHERMRDDGAIYWRDLIHILSHPYTARLLAQDLGEETQETLQKLLDAIPLGTSYQNWESLLTRTLQEPAQSSVFALLTTLITQCHAAKSLGELSLVYHDVCERLALLLPHAHYPLDAKALQTVLESLLPTIASSLLANTPLPKQTQYTLFNALLAQEEIPFEADPLTGLQVVGLFETALVHFQALHIVDASDDILPGIPNQDPLFPEELRRLTGLPTLAERQLKSEYHLFRLAASSQSLTLYWQEGHTNSQTGEGKKIPSRFVEQMLWQIEQEQGHVITNGPPLERANVILDAPLAEPVPLPKTEAIALKLNALIAQGISSTALDHYLSCPRSFACHYLLNLTPHAEVNEGDCPDKIGQCIHALLKRLYTPFLGKSLPAQAISKEELLDALHTELAITDFGNIPAVSASVLETAAEILLGRFLEQQPPTTILALEKNFQTDVSVAKKNYHLYGVIDRLDRRNDSLLLLDYKTGRLKLPNLTFWDNEALFDEIDHMLFGNASHNDLQSLLGLVRDTMPSLQLPFYLVLCTHKCQDLYHALPHNAALIHLAEDGKEMPLFAPDSPLPDLKRLRFCTSLVALAITCLTQSQAFEPLVGQACTYCPYQCLCLLPQ